MKSSVITAVVFLLLVCLAHLARFAFRIEVTAGGFAIPQWMSIAAAIATGGVAAWLIADSRRK